MSATQGSEQLTCLVTTITECRGSVRDIHGAGIAVGGQAGSVYIHEAAGPSGNPSAGRQM